MRRYLKYLLLLLLVSSCASSRLTRERRQVSKKVGIEVGSKDNLRLYQEVANWIGTPHCIGGEDGRCIDCSAFVRNIYRDVYSVRLQRTADGMRTKDVRRITKGALKEGDLVFFGSSRRANHVGIFLKSDKFVHVSSSRGVMISDLDEAYFKKQWLSGGRVTKR